MEAPFAGITKPLRKRCRRRFFGARHQHVQRPAGQGDTQRQVTARKQNAAGDILRRPHQARETLVQQGSQVRLRRLRRYALPHNLVMPRRGIIADVQKAAVDFLRQLRRERIVGQRVHHFRLGGGQPRILPVQHCWPRRLPNPPYRYAHHYQQNCQQHPFAAPMHSFAFHALPPYDITKKTDSMRNRQALPR